MIAIKYFLLCGIFITTISQVCLTTEKEIVIDPEAPCDCGETFSTNSGTFNSPGHPSSYPNNLDCIWQINVNPPAVIGVHFIDDVLLQHCDTCDYIEIRDGLTSDSPLLARLTGHVMPSPIYSTSNAMWIRFRTDTVGTMSGFNATYLAEKLSTTTIVPTTSTTTSSSYPTWVTSTIKSTTAASTTTTTTVTSSSQTPATTTTSSGISVPGGSGSNIVINNNNNLFVYMLPEYLLKWISNLNSSTPSPNFLELAK